MYELSPKGTVIATVTVTDTDAIFRYKIDPQSNSKNIFGITDGGDVIVAAPLLIYAESKHIYNLSVVAYGGFHPSITTTVTIEILELFNRHTPQFVNGTAVNLRISENTEVGTELGRIVAIDWDKGISGELTYNILSDNSSGRFGVSPRSGSLTVEGGLDRRSNETTYQLVVEAKDGGTAKPNSTRKNNLTVTIVVYKPGKNTCCIFLPRFISKINS